MSELASTSESMPVQLTRMEGTINLIKYQNEDVIKRVTHLETTTGKTQADVQKLQLEAVARDATAIALATALKEAEEQRKNKYEQGWTPVQRFIAIVGIMIAVGSFWFAITR